MSQSHGLLPLTVFSVLLLVGAGCTSTTPRVGQQGAVTQPVGMAGAKQTPPPGMMAPQSAPELTDAQKVHLEAGKEPHAPKELTFNITGGSFFYAPNEIRVKKGDKVKFIMTSAGGHHNIDLDEFNVKTEPVNTGEQITAEFTADKVGSFEYYCSVGRHRQMGQKGTLIVEE